MKELRPPPVHCLANGRLLPFILEYHHETGQTFIEISARDCDCIEQADTEAGYDAWLENIAQLSAVGKAPVPEAFQVRFV